MFSGAVSADGMRIVNSSDMSEWVTYPVSLLGSGTEIITNCFGQSKAKLSSRRVQSTVTYPLCGHVNVLHDYKKM